MVLQRLRAAPTPLLALADAAITGLWAVTGLRRPKPPVPHDYTLTIEVVDRQVVAHDENVVALTLAAADRSALPPWYPVTTRAGMPAARSSSTNALA